MRTKNLPMPRAQQGMALISALLLLLVVTIMAVSMFRSYGMQEKIAGNTREKQRALNAAVSAQQYAEWWLTNGTVPPAAACASGSVNSNVGQLCTNALADPTAVPWASRVTYTQFTANPINGAQILTTKSGVNAVGPGTYYDSPAFYVTDLGPAAPGSGWNGEMYQIDAVGYGGTKNAVAVVESTYVIYANAPKGHDK